MIANASKQAGHNVSRPRFTITISRQLGSLGFDVANITAEQLGYRIVSRELINQAAIRAGVPEMALATIDELGLLGVSPTRKDSRAYRQAVQQVMNELAAEGNVIVVGRAGQVVLAGRPEVLHVRIIAPSSVRAHRIALRQNIPLSSAQAQVEASDHSRSNYMKRFYRVRWDNPELYDLIINTKRVSIRLAAELIRVALSQFQNDSKTRAPTSGALI